MRQVDFKTYIVPPSTTIKSDETFKQADVFGNASSAASMAFRATVVDTIIENVTARATDSFPSGAIISQLCKLAGRASYDGNPQLALTYTALSKKLFYITFESARQLEPLTNTELQLLDKLTR